MCHNKELKYLWIYSAADEWTVSWHQKLLRERKKLGFDVKGFCNTPIEFNRRWLPFPELDRLWNIADTNLINMYLELVKELEEIDVLILYNGANLHPEFLQMLNVLKVYTAGDDPESTEILTKPVAKYFDIHLVNNIACLDMYKSWGCRNVNFWPLGSLKSFEDLHFTEEMIADISLRPIEQVFIGGYQSHRKERFDLLSSKFSDAFFAGSGWPKGRIGWEEMWDVYASSQIGWNFHNSTGPINFRLYELPSYGIMQICDNKSHLNGIFLLDKEVVGFDTIDECIEKTRYYTEHKQEQRDIAIAGWKRWQKDYTPEKVWRKLVAIVEQHVSENSLRGTVDTEYVYKQLKKHRDAKRIKRVFYKTKQNLKETLAKYK